MSTAMSSMKGTGFLPFAEVETSPALVRNRRQPPQPIIGDARCVSEPTGELFRYWLTRRWMLSERMILWVTFNPMGGTAKVDDSALKRMITLSWRWGFGGVLLTNLYPLQARSMDTVLAWRDGNRDTNQWRHFEESAQQAGKMADKLRCVTRVAAWGKLDHDGHDDLDEWLELFASKAPARCLGIGMTGDPLQPAGRSAATLAASPVNNARLVRFEYPVGIARLTREERLKKKAERIQHKLEPLKKTLAKRRYRAKLKAKQLAAARAT